MPKWVVMTTWMCSEFPNEAAARKAYNKVEKRLPPHSVEFKRNGGWVILVRLHDTKCSSCKVLKTL